MARATLGLSEEGGAPGGVMPKLIAQDPEGAGGVLEPAGDAAGRLPVDKEGTEGFVLPVEGLARPQEEGGLR